MKNKLSKISQLLALTSLVLVSGNTLAAKTKYIPEGYTVETISIPAGVRLHATGLDTDKEGTVYVGTRFGEVWRYKNEQWVLIAEGMHEITGLKYEDDKTILIAQKPELTRLTDHDGDGVMDEYTRVASGWAFHDNYHEYNFGPVKDKAGNYYGTLNLGHDNPDTFKWGAMDSPGGYRGWAYKVTPEGEFIPYASGLRSPAGIGISPNEEIFFTDNQGDWVETSKLHLLKEEAFYGHPVSLRDHTALGKVDKVQSYDIEDFDKMRELPVVWFPHDEVSNSPGNPEWDVTEGKFGPFKGQIFIGDQTQSNLFRVILDKVNGTYQGAVINFIDGFQSGNIRTEFDNKGQLWVGQTARGWHSKGGKPFGLQKVTWDGTNPFELLDIKLTKKGFKLKFTSPLDAQSVKKLTLQVDEWNYKYTNRYGSPKQNEETLKVTKSTLSNDNLTLTIELPLRERKVVALSFKGLKDKQGRQPSVTKVYYTLNQLLK